MKHDIEKALTDLSVYLKQGNHDRSDILQYLKSTPLPFISCYVDELTLSERFDYAFRFLQRLGKSNAALSVGFCMNQYIAFSISALPASAGSSIDNIKKTFIPLIRDNRWLMAVSSFDDFIRHKNDTKNQVHCVTQPDGSVRCNGVKNFQSNITASDILLFSGQLDQKGTALFYAFIKDNPAITLGDPLYPGAMADADTRSITLLDLELSQEQVVPTTHEDEALGLHALTRVVFSVMAMAPYLGSALRALEEAISFLQSVSIDQKPMAMLDGYVTDMGRAKIKYQLCEDMIDRFRMSIATLSLNTLEDWINRETPKVQALKYHVSATCEELVDISRKVIGTRALLPDHIISRISEQIRFAALHPVINAKIERDMGSRLMSEVSHESHSLS